MQTTSPTISSGRHSSSHSRSMSPKGQEASLFSLDDVGAHLSSPETSDQTTDPEKLDEAHKISSSTAQASENTLFEKGEGSSSTISKETEPSAQRAGSENISPGSLNPDPGHNGAAQTSDKTSHGNLSPTSKETESSVQHVGSENISSGSSDPGPGQNLNSGTAQASEDSLAEKTRTMVLCFDGTGNKFGKNSNVIRFFHALKKDETDKQIVYYQPGIGTYLKSQFKTKTLSRVVSKVDQAIALGLGDHVMDGYRFIMQNHRKGDKICLFGFSRGAYTARALSGMLYKIGLLPAHNDQQVDFAFSVYKDSGREGSALGSKFKRIFATPIKVDFLGVWDTVSSVGIIPQSLPYSTQNDGVRVFRHALALDERRARFRPNIWGEPLPVREELDDDPDVQKRGTDRDRWVYNPPPVPDVLEVWFAGCHADIGGGSHGDEVDTSLSNIPLRWMIRECFLSNTGIIFDVEHLQDLGINIKPESGTTTIKAAENNFPKQDVIEPAPTTSSGPLVDLGKRDLVDAIALAYDQLDIVKYVWWPLELVPMLSTRQRKDGSWWRLRFRNLGYGRYLPFDADHLVKVHSSVKDRMKNTDYKPKALNWEELAKPNSNLLKWMD